MIFAILAFVAVFVLIGSIGVLMFYREAALDRISQVINPRRASRRRWSRLSRIRGRRSATW